MPKGVYKHKTQQGFQKGHLNHCKSHTRTTKKKIGKANMGNQYGWIDGRWKNGGKEYHQWLKHRNRRMKKASEGSHTFGEWELLKKQYGFTCPHCGKKEPEIKLTEDHIIPLSKGGSDYIENIQPLCGKGNSEKYTKTITYKNNA